MANTYIQQRNEKKMKKIGFSKVDAYGDFDFSAYDQNARTMIIVARK